MSDFCNVAAAFEHVSKSFGTKQILHDVSFDVRAEEALCISWALEEPIRA